MPAGSQPSPLVHLSPCCSAPHPSLSPPLVVSTSVPCEDPLNRAERWTMVPGTHAVPMKSSGCGPRCPLPSLSGLLQIEWCLHSWRSWGDPTRKGRVQSRLSGKFISRHILQLFTSLTEFWHPDMKRGSPHCRGRTKIATEEDSEERDGQGAIWQTRGMTRA